jgi:hypothetical protein
MNNNYIMDQSTQTGIKDEPKKRGRKPLGEGETRRTGTFIKCPCCEDAFYYDYKDPKFKRDKKAKD